MDEAYAIKRFELAAELLPLRWRKAALQIPDWKKARAEELRMRTGRTMTILMPEGEQMLVTTPPYPTVTQTDLEQLCDVVTGYSRYAATHTISKGYLIAQGGFRIGLCGSAVMQGGVNTNLRDISSASIRIGRERTGLAEPLLNGLLDDGQFCSTLLIAPPGAGKTTLLRDLIRILSNGTEEMPAHRVSVVDERGELAAMYQGSPQMDLGAHTDILDACPKGIGISMMLRASNPQIIAVDEITAREDLEAMEQAMNCGVKFLATIHARDLRDLGRRPLLRQILKYKLFERAITITAEEGRRRYHVEAIQ
ncbi:MAG: stage III sporulation protein AA [Ruminococcaceae bacterium]|nr:stage III sporulation protein AA [Oscillospiraceae bacterium]